MNHEDREGFEDQVRSACQRGTSWNVLAELLHVRISGSPSPTETAEIKGVACDASGYSIGLINRYVAAIARVKLIAEKSALKTADLLSPVFNAVEIAAKLYEVDQDQGLDSLKQLKEGKTTLAAVKKRLNDARDQSGTIFTRPSPMRLSTIERHRREAEMVFILSNHFAPLHGVPEKVLWKKSDKLMACEGLFRIPVGDEERRYDAVEAIVAGPHHDSNYVDTLIPGAMLRSTFFSHYYMIFWTRKAAIHAKRAERLLSWLNSDSIGVLTVEQNGFIKTHRLPSDRARSHPDRTPFLEQMITSSYDKLAVP